MASARIARSKDLLGSGMIHSASALKGRSSSAAAITPARTISQNGKSESPRTAMRWWRGEAFIGLGRRAADSADSMMPLPACQNSPTLLDVTTSTAVRSRDLGGCQPAASWLNRWMSGSCPCAYGAWFSTAEMTPFWT